MFVEHHIEPNRFYIMSAYCGEKGGHSRRKTAAVKSSEQWVYGGLSASAGSGSRRLRGKRV